VCLGGVSIDVDRMAQGAGGSPGYRMQPWEEDSFVRDELVKRLWVGGDAAVLPDPGFCTNNLRYAIQQSGGQGGDGHAH